MLSLIMMAIAIETIEFHGSLAEQAALLAIALVGGGLCVFAWRRFSRLLFRAEYLAERATCAGCLTYARFDVEAAKNVPDSLPGCTLDVRCKSCGHLWTIE